MGELIQGVTALCKLLNYLTNVPIKPDFFRLSKLNKNSFDETQHFLSALHRLCCFSTTDLCQGDAHSCVASYMLRKGGAVAYCLTPGVSGRHLLLCFGWLLSHGLVETCIDKLILDSPLGEELYINDVQIASLELPMRPVANRPEVEQNYALLLAGLIHHNLRAISNFRQEKAQLCAKVHKVTAGLKGLPHLSAGEVKLLLSPELLPGFLTRCRPCLQVLEAHAKWQKKSHLFWQWMGSILSDEENLIAEQIKKEERSYKPLLESEVNHLKIFLKKLEESVKKSVMEEGATTSVGNIANIDTRKMSFRETIVINHKIEALDKEIETLTMMFERKKQELQNKLSKFSNTNVKNEVDCINSVLNMFNVDFKLPSGENMKVQNVKIDSAPLPDQIELLSLHNSSNKFVVNKLVLE